MHALAFAGFVLGGWPLCAQQNATPATTEGDFVVHNFQFRSGESLPDVRLHYTTLG
jgi:homoserine acetyltransferase